MTGSPYRWTGVEIGSQKLGCKSLSDGYVSQDFSWFLHHDFALSSRFGRAIIFRDASTVLQVTIAHSPFN